MLPLDGGRDHGAEAVGGVYVRVRAHVRACARVCACACSHLVRKHNPSHLTGSIDEYLLPFFLPPKKLISLLGY